MLHEKAEGVKKERLLAEDVRVLTVSARRGWLFESSSDGWLNDKDEEDGRDEEEAEEEGKKKDMKMSKRRD